MSLINQVLADLDQRKSGQPLSANGLFIGPISAVSLQASRRTRYLLIGVGVSVAVVLGIFWQILNDRDSIAEATKTNSVPAVVLSTPNDSADVYDATLKLTSELTQIDERKKPEPISRLRLDQLLEHPVAQIAQPVKAPVAQTAVVPLRKYLRGIWVKEISTLTLGHKQPVQLLLSGNVGRAIDDAASLRKKGGRTQHVTSLLSYTPPLVLDPSIVASAKPIGASKAVSTANATPLRSQPDTAMHRIVDDRQHEGEPAANLRDVQLKSTPKNRQPQKHSIRQVTDVQRADQIYQHALALNAEGDLNQSLAQLKQAILLDENHLKARYTLAALLINADQPDAALQELISGLNMQPDYAPFAQLYGRLKMQSGELDDAIEVMQRARHNAQNDPAYYVQLAAIYQQQGAHPEAIAYFQQALRWQSTEGAWWMGMGVSLEQQHQYRKAVIAYRRAESARTLSDNVLTYVRSRIQVLEDNRK